MAKEKVKLEAQVTEALKYASEKVEEARHASFQFRGTQRGLKILNNGTNQLDHLLIIGKNDRFGLGFEAESSKAEGVLYQQEKTEVVATPATNP